MIYAKNIKKTPKNEVFDVFLLKKNTGSTHRGTARVLRVSGPWIGTLPVQYPYPKPLRVPDTPDLHYSGHHDLSCCSNGPVYLIHRINLIDVTAGVLSQSSRPWSMAQGLLLPPALPRILHSDQSQDRSPTYRS